MYSPSIITTEPAILPLPVAKGLISSTLLQDSFSEGTPCLVEIEPLTISGLLTFANFEYDTSLILNSSLSAQTNPFISTFWSKPDQSVEV